MKVLNSIENFLLKIESVTIVILLSVMILFSFTQIILRNFFSIGFVEGDSLLRHFVLWIGFIGASIATHNEKHINIDIFSRILPNAIKKKLHIFINGFAFIVCLILTNSSLNFLKMERESSQIFFENLQIPLWYLQIILPVGFALISFRFFIKLIKSTLILFEKEK